MPPKTVSRELEPVPANLRQSGLQLREDITEAIEHLSVLANIVGDLAPDNSYPVENLTPTMLRELDSASQGVSVDDQAEATDRHPGTIDRCRHDMVKRVGAKSLPHLTRIGITAGVLDIEFDEKPLKPASLSKQGYQVSLMVSYGMTTDDIAKAAKMTSSKVDAAVKEARQALGANNRPHLVRRAFEAGVFKMPEAKPEKAVELAEAAQAVQKVSSIAVDAAELSKNFLNYVLKEK